MNKKPPLVFIPGLGADERLFSFINLLHFEKNYIRWIKPEPDDTLVSYIMKLKSQVMTDEAPVLIGVSLGGIIAMEWREMVPVRKTFLISSVKDKTELPGYFSMVRKFRLHEKITPSMLKSGSTFIKPFISDTSNSVSKNLFEAMVHDADDDFIIWGIKQVLHWKRTLYSNENIIHIHGTKDLVFPLRNIRNYNYCIKNGSHDMIMSKPDEINEILKQELNFSFLFSPD